MGNDGLVGVSLTTGGGRTPGCEVVLVPGTAFRLPVARLADEFRTEPDLMRLLLRYIQASRTQMSQMAVRHRHHSIRQKLCVLFLLILDRRSSMHIPMIQEMIGHTLGVRREGVTEAACIPKKAGVIQYGRGRIEILDRLRLAAIAFEFYAVVRRACDRLTNLSPPSGSRVRMATGRSADALHLIVDGSASGVSSAGREGVRVPYVVSRRHSASSCGADLPRSCR